MIRVERYAVMTIEDAKAIRAALRAAGIKGSVKVGRGSMRCEVRVRTPAPNEGVVGAVTALGYEFQHYHFLPFTGRHDYVFGRLENVVYVPRAREVG